jgi:hypothetical protein
VQHRSVPWPLLETSSAPRFRPPATALRALLLDEEPRPDPWAERRHRSVQITLRLQVLGEDLAHRSSLTVMAALVMNVAAPKAATLNQQSTRSYKVGLK